MGDLFASLQARTPSTHTLSGGVDDAQAWTRANLSEKDWLVPLSVTCLAELKRVVEALRQDPGPVTNPSPSQFSLIECTQLMSRVQDKLRHGPGIAIVDRIRIDDFSAEENRAVYWLLASMIAPIVPQKCDGTMIYDVKDSRKTLAYGVRRSVTNLAQEFHTDGGWLAMPPEFMGLFCLQTAERGGESRFVSLVKVHAEIQRRHPTLLHRLHQAFYWDRQAEHPPNEAKVSVHPIFSHDGQAPFARYYEDYILKGYELAGARLDEQGFAALKAMREIVDLPELCIEFSLEPGQIQFLNNYHFAHSRTGFTDSQTSAKRRHLLRLWTRRNDSGAFDVLEPNASRDPVRLLREAGVSLDASSIAWQAHHGVPGLPTAELLVSGGDSRLRVNAKSGLNKYGCSPAPRDRVLALGSCTASSISHSGFQAAVRAQERLLAVGSGESLRTAMDHAYEHIRRELLSMLTLGRVPGVDVVLATSGTDAELVALTLALGDRSSPLCNVVVGPSEVGSGTLRAAGGHHFDAVVPSGLERVAGEAVDPELTEHTHIETIPLRNADGSTRSQEELDIEAERITAQAIKNGAHVLLHVVAHSKTGVHAPRLHTVADLCARHEGRIAVVVDAAQGRFSRHALIDMLSQGYMVLTTGSKFFGGPPFSGALLVPTNMHPANRGVSSAPAGLGDFLTTGQLPRTWSQLQTGLPSTGNPGLILRWSAALADMRNYYATPSYIRLQVARAFERMVAETLGSSPNIKLFPIAPTECCNSGGRLLESKTTVFPFVVRSQCGIEFGRDSLLTIARWVNTDVSRLILGATPEDGEVLSTSVHLGQPVSLTNGHANERWVLRAALGGELLVKLGTDPSYGPTLSARLDCFASQLACLRKKIEIIAGNFEIMKTQEDALSSTGTAR